VSDAWQLASPNYPNPGLELSAGGRTARREYKNFQTNPFQGPCSPVAAPPVKPPRSPIRLRPAAALPRLSQALADGGQLHIAVPDASRYAEGEDAPFQEFSVEHINFLGPDSPANLLNGYGFRRIFCDQRMLTVNYRIAPDRQPDSK
jgi:hypothetical protein